MVGDKESACSSTQYPAIKERMSKSKNCWHCGRPVNTTVGKSGLCKVCIPKAQTVASDLPRRK